MTSDIHTERADELGQTAVRGGEDVTPARRTGTAIVTAVAAAAAALWTWRKRRQVKQSSRWAKATQAAKSTAGAAKVAATPAAQRSLEVSKKAIRKARSRAAKVIKP